MFVHKDLEFLVFFILFNSTMHYVQMSEFVH